VITIEAGVGIDETVVDAVGRIAERIEPLARKALPGLTASLTLQVHASCRVIPETGTAGSSLSAGVITWSFDPSRPEGGAVLAEKWLASALFHELHHQVRGWLMVGGGGPHRVIHAAVCEGLATAFERDETGVIPPWGMYGPEVSDWVKGEGDDLGELRPDAPAARPPGTRRPTAPQADTDAPERPIRRPGRRRLQEGAPRGRPPSEDGSSTSIRRSTRCSAMPSTPVC
jgi:hypothetical protein